MAIGKVNTGRGKRIELKYGGIGLIGKTNDIDLYARGNGYYYRYHNDNEHLPTSHLNTDRFSTMRVYDRNLRLVRTTTDRGYHEIDEDGNIWRVTSKRMRYDAIVIQKLSPDGTTVVKEITTNIMAFTLICFCIKDSNVFILESMGSTYASPNRLVKININTNVTTYLDVREPKYYIDGSGANLFRMGDYVYLSSAPLSGSGYMKLETVLQIDPERLSVLELYSLTNTSTDKYDNKRIGFTFNNRDNVVSINREKYVKELYAFEKGDPNEFIK